MPPTEEECSLLEERSDAQMERFKEKHKKIMAKLDQDIRELDREQQRLNYEKLRLEQIKRRRAEPRQNERVIHKDPLLEEIEKATLRILMDPNILF